VEYDLPMSPRSADPHQPLAGASVVITRPAQGARAVKARIRAVGGEPLTLPGVRIQGPEDARASTAALQAARAADFVVFVSPNAVKYALKLLPKLRFARTTTLCAMGAATARALARAGCARVLSPIGQQTTEGLIALPELKNLRGRSVAIVGAPGGRDLLAQTLKSRKARVQRIHVYRRAPPLFRIPQLAALDAASPPLITLLSSAEVLENLRASLPLALFGKLAAGELVVSSLRLAEAARASLFVRVHIAASPAPRDLVRAACGALTQHRL
jgi:uroporphyrinogen-III synthase